MGWLYRQSIKTIELSKETQLILSTVDLGFHRNESIVAVSLPGFDFPDKGTFLPFIAIEEDEPNTKTSQKHKFQCICRQQEYQHYSPEELRLADYQNGMTRPLVSFVNPNTGNRGYSTDFPVVASNTGGSTTLLGPDTVLPDRSLSGGFVQASTDTTPFPKTAVGLLLGVSDNQSPAIASASNTPVSTAVLPTNGISIASTMNTAITIRNELTPDEETAWEFNDYQIALISLLIFAEKANWAKLFNAAIDAYMQGEIIIGRKIPFEHVSRIYKGTSAASTLRKFVIDNLANPETTGYLILYINVLKDVDAFGLDVMQKMIGGVDVFAASLSGRVSLYHMYD